MHLRLLCFCTLLFTSTAAATPAPSFDIQAALDALPPSGGIVRVPAGTYDITAPLVVRAGDVTLEGEGAATHIRNQNTAGAPAILLQHPGNAKNARDRKARLWRVSLANFRVSGNPASGDGIRAVGIDEIYVRGVAVDHHGGNGIVLRDCYEDPRLIGNIITYNRAAGVLLEGCHDIVVSANQFEENQDALRCLDGFNLCMTGNNLDDHLRHGVVIENTYGSIVSGNMIEECNGTAIILDRDCYGITVTGNTIAHHLEGGVHLPDAWGCERLLITNNVIVDVNRAAPGAKSIQAGDAKDSLIKDNIGG